MRERESKKDVPEDRFLVSTPARIALSALRPLPPHLSLLDATAKSNDESLWRLQPGMLADLQVQTSLIEGTQLYMQTGQAACPMLRWERSLKELQHTAHYLGLPVGRKHKEAAFQAQALSEGMHDDDLFKGSSKARTSFLKGIKNLIYYRASADMAAMGWAGIRRVAFSAFSLIGWAVDKARFPVSAIVNCLFDDADTGNEVRNRFEVALAAQRCYNGLFGSPSSDANATTTTATAAPNSPAGASIATATAQPAPLASSPEVPSSSDMATVEIAEREQHGGMRSGESSRLYPSSTHCLSSLDQMYGRRRNSSTSVERTSFGLGAALRFGNGAMIC